MKLNIANENQQVMKVIYTINYRISKYSMSTEITNYCLRILNTCLVNTNRLEYLEGKILPIKNCY